MITKRELSEKGHNFNGDLLSECYLSPKSEVMYKKETFTIGRKLAERDVELCQGGKVCHIVDVLEICLIRIPQPPELYNNMLLRDYFAVEAMKTVERIGQGVNGSDVKLSPQSLAQVSYNLADAMLEARKK